MDDVKLLKMAFEKMHDEIEKLKIVNMELKKEFDVLKTKFSTQNESSNSPKDDLLIDTREVLNILGICYNSLQKLIQKGVVKAIRINQRRIRYSKFAILNYISNQ